jgi:nitrate/nitrite transporter NarK
VERHARTQDGDVPLRALRAADPGRDTRGQLAGGAHHRLGRFRASGLVGESLHHRLGHVRQEDVGTIIGLGGMAGSIGGILFPWICGRILDRYHALGNVTAGYAILFAICAVAYLIAFAFHHLLAPKFEPFEA